MGLTSRYLIGNATTVNATITNGTNIIQGTVTYGPTTSKETEYAEKFLGEYLSGISTISASSNLRE